MFGNVGLNDRLTFSAFGSAVNEVQRLQTLTKKYPQNLIASEEFANYCGGGWITLGKEKLRGVKEKLTVLHPDMTDIVDSDDDGAFEISYDGVSDAEQVMLLYRDSAGSPANRQWESRFSEGRDDPNGDLAAATSARHHG